MSCKRHLSAFTNLNCRLIQQKDDEYLGSKTLKKDILTLIKAFLATVPT